MHPAAKVFHAIDFIMLRKSRFVKCVDARVLRSAECWSDHMLVRARWRIQGRPFRGVKSAKPKPFAVHEIRTKPDVRDQYQSKLKTTSTLPPSVDGSPDPEQDWATICKAMQDAAEETMDRGRRRQQDWFLAAIDTVQPLIDQKNAAQVVFTQSPTEKQGKEYRASQRCVSEAVRLAKEKWVCDLATKAEDAVRNG